MVGKLGSSECKSKLVAPTVTSNGAKIGLKEAVLGRRVSPRRCNAEKRPSDFVEGSGIDMVGKLGSSERKSKLVAPTVTSNGAKIGLKEAVLGRRVSPRRCNAEKRPSDLVEGSKSKLVAPTVTSNGAKIGLKEAVLGQRVSPRRCNAEKRPSDLVEGSKSKLVAPTVTSNGAKIGLKEAVLGRRVSPRRCNAEKRPSDFVEGSGSGKRPRPRESTREGSDNSGTCCDSVEHGQGSSVDPNQYELKWLDDRGSQFNRSKETLRMPSSHCLRFVQEERRFVNGVINDKQILKGSKTNILKSNEVLYPKKRSRNLSGIGVMQRFFSRDDLIAVGFRGDSLKEIDHMGMFSRDMEKYKGHKFPLALVLVLSDQYGNLDKSEEFVYTAEDGNDTLGNEHADKDQEMNRGNLAFKNNMDQSVPVRVICEHECDSSYNDKVYIYEGLFKVVRFWSDKCSSGFTKMKYVLCRLPGQPKLLKNQVPSTHRCLPKALSGIPGLVWEDISNGQEPICIPATNIYDDPLVGPEGFTYVKSIQISDSVNFPPDAPGCNCKGSCTNSKTCSCAQLNGSGFPYVGKDGGRLIESSDVVFECGPRCNCGPSCINRTSQQGLKYQLEVYRTPKKGWAVRSWDFIPSGAPVCEYVGVLRKSDELEHASENEYIFEIDCWQTINEIDGREKRYRDVSVPWSDDPCDRKDGKMQESEYCIDAGSFGNVARFINHSCEPNLFIQCVLSSHRDIRFARLMLFASDDIPPMQELTYDYGYALDSVIGSDGKVKELPCFCGAACCRKRLY